MFCYNCGMKISKKFGIQGASKARGTTIIIDVFRAATVCAFLLSKGVEKIIPVSTKEEAFLLKQKNPEWILVGENHGIKIEGFEYGNSPSEINLANNLKDKTVIHRTSKGTQGIVHAKNADIIIFGSFVTAYPIISYLQLTKPKHVSIVSTDVPGSEDDIFADYLINRLMNKKSKNMQEIKQSLKESSELSWYFDPKKNAFPEEDFHLCLDLNRFNFVPIVQGKNIIKYAV